VAAATVEGDIKMKKRRRLADDEVPSGTTIHVGLELMDSWQRDVASWARTYRDHQPGFRTVASREVKDARDAARAARDSWVKAKTEAWRTGTSSYIPPINTPVGDARAQAIQARLDRIKRMNDAWRTVRDNPGFLQPQTPERQRLWNAMRAAGAKVDGNGDPDDPDDDADDNGNGQDAVERRRAREHADRKRSLAEAWRGPAAAANQVEQNRRTYTYENAPRRPVPGGA
jgi:hypothetical protein